MFPIDSKKNLIRHYLLKYNVSINMIYCTCTQIKCKFNCTSQLKRNACYSCSVYVHWGPLCVSNLYFSLYFDLDIVKFCLVLNLWSITSWKAFWWVHLLMKKNLNSLEGSSYLRKKWAWAVRRGFSNFLLTKLSLNYPVPRTNRWKNRFLQCFHISKLISARHWTDSMHIIHSHVLTTRQDCRSTL